MASIGFIGLGHMGLPMATHLVAHGHQVYGFDINPKARQNFLNKGGNVLENLDDFSSQQTIIITMLQTGAQVQEVLLHKPGLFEQLPKNTFYIDCSSIDVIDAKKLHQEAQNKGINQVDAPVSGGVGGANAATLTFMVGGTPNQFEQAKTILACMGKNIIHTGNATTGQVAKICNNMILGVSMIAVSEAFLLAQKLGLSAQKFHEVAMQSSSQCWVMNQYVPVAKIIDNVPANHDYKAGFTSAMMLKDLLSSQHASELAQISTPMGKKATDLYKEVNQAGMSGLDFSVIFQFLLNNTKTT